MNNKYFKTQELISRAVYEEKGDRAIDFLNPKILEVLVFIREGLNVPLIVNNWSFGGRFQYRGYREPQCKEGAKKSQHREGNAIDFHSTILSPEAIRNWIKRNADKLPYPIRLEEDVNWVHIDLANKGITKVETFKP